MRIAFYTPGWKQPEQDLLAALQKGCRDAEVVAFRNVEIHDGYDLACVVGVKAIGLVKALREKGTPFLYWDKGYHREWPAWWRVAISAHQPTSYIADMACPGDRASAQNWSLAPWQAPDPRGHILIAGSSLKYNNFHGLPHPTQMATELVGRIRQFTDRPIVYRPKPSWGGAEPIPGTRFSWSRTKNFITIYDDLLGAHCLITHGSNACFEALQAGVPSIVTGDAALRPIFSTDIAEVEDPRRASMGERIQIVSNLAYCQWSLKEIERGEAWQFLRRQLTEMESGG